MSLDDVGTTRLIRVSFGLEARHVVERAQSSLSSGDDTSALFMEESHVFLQYVLPPFRCAVGSKALSDDRNSFCCTFHEEVLFREER